MYKLLELQFIRTIRQKALWVYLLAIFIMILSGCLSYLKDPLNEFALFYAGAKFPIYALQTQVTTAGPLFFVLIAAFSVNAEKTSGMFKQPLLSGITKIQLLNCKILNLVAIMTISILLMEGLSYLVGYVAWGNEIFSELVSSVQNILLTLIPMTTSCVGFILLTLYTPNIAVTMCVAFIIFLADNLASQFFVKIVEKFSYLYYVYAYSLFNAKPLESWMIPKGLAISLITGIIFYLLAFRKIHKMQF